MLHFYTYITANIKHSQKKLQNTKLELKTIKSYKFVPQMPEYNIFLFLINSFGPIFLIPSIESPIILINTAPNSQLQVHTSPNFHKLLLHNIRWFFLLHKHTIIIITILWEWFTIEIFWSLHDIISNIYLLERMRLRTKLLMGWFMSWFYVVGCLGDVWR